MGYTTEFRGHFDISPPLPAETLEELGLFLEERHSYTTHPSIHCDWDFSDDGCQMYWNGSEKSYNMLQWAIYLKNKFFPSHTVSGRIHARGEEFDDIWEMVACPISSQIRREGWK